MTTLDDKLKTIAADLTTAVDEALEELYTWPYQDLPTKEKRYQLNTRYSEERQWINKLDTRELRSIQVDINIIRAMFLHEIQLHKSVRKTKERTIVIPEKLDDENDIERFIQYLEKILSREEFNQLIYQAERVY